MKLFYKWSTLRRAFKYSAPFLSVLEKPLLQKYGLKHPSYPAVFIIGAPRTGSTIFYQLLTNYFNVSYINNFINLGPRNLFLAFLLNEMIFKNKPHNSFQSKYGGTEADGLNAPHEGGAFWYRWIPKNQDYVSEEMVRQIDVDEIQKYIFAVINRFDRPFLFKNLKMGMRIALLQQISADNKYIFVKRDPFYVAQSIINGRIRIFNDPSTWWSVKPPNYMKLLYLNFVEQVVRQIYSIEQQIHKDLNYYVDDSNILTVYYEDLSSNINYLRSIYQHFNIPLKKTPKHFQAIENKNEIKCNKDLMIKIREEVEKLDWDNYSTEI